MERRKMLKQTEKKTQPNISALNLLFFIIIDGTYVINLYFSNQLFIFRSHRTMTLFNYYKRTSLGVYACIPGFTVSQCLVHVIDDS